MTLIELMIVLTLMMVLAGLAVMFVPRMGEQDRAARGGTMLQGWLNTAKAKAVLYQIPVGVRLIPDATNPKLVYQASYIEADEDYRGSLSGFSLTTYVDAKGNSNLAKVVIANTDLTNNTTVQAEWAVQVGSYLEVFESGLLHRVTDITYNATQTRTEVTLNSQLPFAISNGTTNYRIQRPVRVTADELLQTPDGIAIDLNTNVTYQDATTSNTFLPPANSDGSIDILFSPSGAVITSGLSTDTINLWVRDVSDPLNTDVFKGEPSIIAIYSRTGFTAAHPPADGTDPYAYVKDGLSSGK